MLERDDLDDDAAASTARLARIRAEVARWSVLAPAGSGLLARVDAMVADDDETAIRREVATVLREVLQWVVRDQMDALIRHLRGQRVHDPDSHDVIQDAITILATTIDEFEAATGDFAGADPVRATPITGSPVKWVAYKLNDGVRAYERRRRGLTEDVERVAIAANRRPAHVASHEEAVVAWVDHERRRSVVGRLIDGCHRSLDRGEGLDSPDLAVRTGPQRDQARRIATAAAHAFVEGLRVTAIEDPCRLDDDAGSDLHAHLRHAADEDDKRVERAELDSVYTTAASLRLGLAATYHPERTLGVDEVRANINDAHDALQRATLPPLTRRIGQFVITNEVGEKRFVACRAWLDDDLLPWLTGHQSPVQVANAVTDSLAWLRAPGKKHGSPLGRMRHEVADGGPKAEAARRVIAIAERLAGLEIA